MEGLEDKIEEIAQKIDKNGKEDYQICRVKRENGREECSWAESLVVMTLPITSCP